MRCLPVGLVVLCLACSSSSPTKGNAGGTGVGGTAGTHGSGGHPATGGSSGTAGGGAGNGTSGAGGSGPALGDYATGTRLHAMVWQASADAKAVHGWYDSELGVTCAFHTSSDGTTRCMPDALYIDAFADSKCQTPLTTVPGTCAAAKYASQNGGTCGDVVSGYRVGSQTTPAATFGGSPQNCYSATYGTGTTFYSVTPEPATTFIAGKLVTDARSADLKMRFYKTDDGAAVPVSPFDVTRNAACAPGTIDPVIGRCAPSDTAIDSQALKFYTDNKCQNLVAHVPNCVTPSAVEALLLDQTDICNPHELWKYWEIGAKVSGAVFQSGASCAPTTFSYFTYYAIGAPIDASSFPAVGTVDLGSDRVKARYYTSHGQHLVFQTFYDSQLGVECQPLPTSAGIRCLPKGPSFDVFADDKCQNLLAYANAPKNNCADPAPPKYVMTQDPVTDVCTPGAQHAYTTGAKVQVQGLYTKGPTSCDANGIDPNGLIFWSTTAIADSSLGAIQDVTE